MFSMTRRLFTALMTCALLLSMSACLPLCPVCLCPADTAHAATFTINRDGSEGGAQLTQAVFDANTQPSGTHTITFDTAVKNVTLNEEITIRTNLTVNGNGATITGSGSTRLFRVTLGSATFNQLTFTGGNTTGNGGAVEIDSQSASAVFRNCTFYRNHAAQAGGAVSITEGNVVNRTQFFHCTVTNNSAASGGGISLASGEASVYASVVISNGSGDIAGSVQTTDTITGADYDTGNVLMLNGSGIPELVEVNGVKVVKLSPLSPAIDYIAAGTSYTLGQDETGRSRPQLFGYDLGAYEAPPTQAQTVTIKGERYIPVGFTERFRVEVTPTDASRNTSTYPGGIRWWAADESILRVSDSGDVRAVNVGDSFVLAQFQGWNADGEEAPVTAQAFPVKVGTQDREPLAISISPIDGVSMDKQEYRTVTPVVALTANEIAYEPEVGGNYELLSAAANPAGIVTATLSGDSIIVMAQNTAGTCEVDVTVSTIPPEGSTGNAATVKTASRTFTVNVSERVYDPGHSRGGGGCEGVSLGVMGLLMITITICVRRRKD